MLELLIMGVAVALGMVSESLHNKDKSVRRGAVALNVFGVFFWSCHIMTSKSCYVEAKYMTEVLYCILPVRACVSPYICLKYSICTFHKELQQQCH